MPLFKQARAPFLCDLLDFEHRASTLCQGQTLSALISCYSNRANWQFRRDRHPELMRKGNEFQFREELDGVPFESAVGRR